MARYTDAVCRLCRREGAKLYLKSDRCYSDKCALERHSYAPGDHGRQRKKESEYGLQLREKQKARRIYGLLEKQFHNYFVKAERQKGVTGENLLKMLERRLDNVVYRLGFAGSRAEARQIIRHGHFEINGKKANIPSILLKADDEISVREKSKKNPRLIEMSEAAAHKTPPAWLHVEPEKMRGKVMSIPTREEIDVPIQEHLIIELYSR